MSFNDEIDDEAFEAAYDRYSQMVCELLGFATRSPAGQTVSPTRRLGQVRARSEAAHSLVVELQQWLVDDDPTVRSAARDGVRAVMFQAYTGDQSDGAWRKTHQPYWIDSALERLLRSADPDGPEPTWMHPPKQRHIRLASIVLALGLAISAGVALVLQQTVLALPLLFLAGVVDVFDGAFARVSQMRNAELRWLSCIFSQAGDLLMLGSIAYAQFLNDSIGRSVLIATAMLAALFGAFVRVSALQAGYRFWRSRAERFLRYGAIATYCVVAASGHSEVGAVIVTVLVGGFGLVETLRVVRAVIRMPSVQGGGVLFVDDGDELHAWELTDTSPSPEWLEPSVSRGPANDPTMTS